MAAQSTPDNSYILGLDIGNSRVGLALAHSYAKLPNPYAVLENNDEIWAKLADIIDSERVSLIVVGLPRDKDGQETDQSKVSREFAGKLMTQTNLPIEFADESLSSVRSEQSNYKSTSPKHFDDIAACYILEEFFGNING